MLVHRLKQVTTQTIALTILLSGIASFAVAQESNEKLRKFRVESAKKLKEPEYPTEPRYLLVCFGKELKDGHWLAAGPQDVYFDSNGNGDLTEDGEHFTKFDVIQEPPGGRWKETRWFKIGVVGNVPLTLMIKIPSPLYRPRKTVMPSVKKAMELDIKHQWGHGGLQYMAGKTGRQHMTLLRLAKEKETSHVTWIDGPVSVAQMQEVIGQKAVFDISKRVLPGTLRVRLGTYGLAADESVIPSFTALNPLLIPKKSFPVAELKFKSGDINRTLSRRVGGSGFMAQFKWPMKVTEDEVPVTVVFSSPSGFEAKPWTGTMRIIRDREQLEKEALEIPKDAKVPTPVKPKIEEEKKEDTKSLLEPGGKREPDGKSKTESGSEGKTESEPGSGNSGGNS